MGWYKRSGALSEKWEQDGINSNLASGYKEYLRLANSPNKITLAAQTPIVYVIPETCIRINSEGDHKEETFPWGFRYWKTVPLSVTGLTSLSSIPAEVWASQVLHHHSGSHMVCLIYFTIQCNSFLHLPSLSDPLDHSNTFFGECMLPGIGSYLAAPLKCCVILSMLLNISVPQFLHLWKKKSTYMITCLL